MHAKCPMTKSIKNYQLFTFWWFKSLYPALTKMRIYVCFIETYYIPLTYNLCRKENIYGRIYYVSILKYHTSCLNVLRILRTYFHLRMYPHNLVNNAMYNK